ncbi:MAG: hypothetical protein JXQ75_12330, partial [Phycisphaerae bacterium]|nr:hypothetical protein [Phycisphaerae bacterium]
MKRTCHHHVFKLKALLCVLLTLNVQFWLGGCAPAPVPFSPGATRIELTPGHPLSMALRGSAFEGATAVEVDPGKGEFRLIFPDAGRQLSGKYAEANGTPTITEFHAANGLNSATIHLDISKHVTSITTSDGHVFTAPTDWATSPASTEGANAYERANAQLLDFARQLNSQSNPGPSAGSGSGGSNTGGPISGDVPGMPDKTSQTALGPALLVLSLLATIWAVNMAALALIGIFAVLAALQAMLPRQSNQSEDEQTETDEGSMGSTGSYSIQYYKMADPAQKAIKNGTIPNVLVDHGNLLVLDLTTWPQGWQTGNIVAVRMPSDVVEYRRLLTRFELSDGRLAIGAVEAGLLEVIHSGEVTIEGDLSQTVGLQSDSTARIIEVIDYADENTFWIIQEHDVDLFTYSEGGTEIELTFPQISLKATPHIGVKLVIDKSDDWIDMIADAIIDFAVDIAEAMSNLLEGISGLLCDDANGQVICDISEDLAQEIINDLLEIEEIVHKLEAIVDVLSDPTNLKEGRAIVDGEIVGTVELSAFASAEYHPDPWEQPLATVLIPITGPIPIFLQFDLVGVATLDFDAQVDLCSRLDITIPFRAGILVTDGIGEIVSKPDSDPAFTFTEPDFAGTRGHLELAVGVQCEAGVSLAEILTATVDPTAEMVFETTAELTGGLAAGCVNLDWDLYGRLRAELEAELSIPFMDPIWQDTWNLPFQHTILQGERPNGTWQDCWGDAADCGNGVCEVGEDSTNCPQDCETGGPVCGDGVCDAGEDSTNCPQDCEAGGP